jgi:hypothetical protein
MQRKIEVRDRAFTALTQLSREWGRTLPTIERTDVIARESISREIPPPLQA